MRQVPCLPLPSAAEQLLAHLSEPGSHLRLRSTAWHLIGKGESQKIEASLIRYLQDRGHLIEVRPGHLQSLAAQRAASGKLSDHRPVRPEGDDMAAPPQLRFHNEAESPLSWLRSRKDKAGKPLISDQQFMAGERLRQDYERATLGPRVTASWEAPVGGRSQRAPGHEMTDAIIAARERYHKALEAVGPELAGILVQVCCLAAGIEQAERILELPQRSGKAVLGLSLNALARHYGFAGDPRRKKQSRSVGGWALPDYRPSIPPAGEG